MYEMLSITIEAGVGLAGFAGIAVVLSGDPRKWSSAEKFLLVFFILVALLLAANAAGWFSLHIAPRRTEC